MRAPACKIFLLLLSGLLVGFEWEGRLANLQRDLDEGDAARRREVVRLLASYPPDAVGDWVLDALSDEDPGVRAEAAKTAGRIRLQRAVPNLRDWLGDQDADVRASAAVALGRIGSPRVVPGLVRLLGDGRVEVRRAAVEALAAIGTPEVVRPLLGRLDDSHAEVRVDAAEALGALGDTQALVPLVSRLRDDAPEVRQAVFTALGALGSARAVPALLPGLQDGTPEVRLAAIGALGRVGDRSAVRSLVPLVEDADHRVARAAVTALGNLGGTAAVEGIVTALGPRETRETAASTLLHLCRASEPSAQAAVVARLAEALRRTHSDETTTIIAQVLLRLAERTSIDAAVEAVRQALDAGRGRGEILVRALGATGAPDALVPLLERLEAEDEDTHGAVLDALHRLFDRLPPDGRAADPLLAAAARLPASQLPELVRLVGRVGAERAVPTLRDLVTHPRPQVRLASVRALGAIGDARAASALVPLLDDADGRTRFEAARALRFAASVDTVQQLLQRLTTPEPQDRHAILMALGGTLRRLHANGDLATSQAQAVRHQLAPLLTGEDRKLMARTVDALGQWGDPANATLLIQRASEGPPSLRRQALRVLGAVPGEAARAHLREVLTSDEPTLVAHAAAALGEHGEPTDAPRLLALVASGAFPSAAAASFGLVRMLRRDVGHAEAKPPALCALLRRSRDPYVRANLAVALTLQEGAACEEGPDPAHLLGPRHAPVVRVAAARWLAAQARAGHAPRGEAVLRGCAAEDPAPSVARACDQPALPPLGARADVYAYAPDGSQLWTDRPVALRFADGTAWVVHSDLNGHVWLEDAADGALLLDDPVSTPLEP